MKANKKELVHVSKSGRVYKQRNALPTCRRSFKSFTGKIISLNGRKGFEWSVNETTCYSVVKSTVFQSRAEALKYYNILLKDLKRPRYD